MKKFGYFNLYVIKGIDGDILIDTGFIGIKKGLKRWLDKFNIKLVILTHAHVDHTWNVDYIKELYGCSVAIGSYDVCNIGKYIKSSPSKKRYKTWTKLMHFGMKKFIQKKFDVDYVFNDGDVFEKYGIRLEIVHLPGHTNGSIGILYDKYLFCGDALVNRKRKVEIAYQNEDNIAAEKSILKIMDIKPEIIFVGHDREIHFSKLKKSFSNVF